VARTGTPAAAPPYAELTPCSRALFERALASLPGGNTRTTIFHDPYPVYLERGEGCRVWDVDGVERIDFVSNYTSLVHGHCHPSIVEAVQRQAARLTSAAGPSELEVELAERIRERLPSVELVRFCNSGTEATMLALRAARAFTGREKVLAFAGAYHGTHDLAVAIPPEPGAADARGVPRPVAESLVVAPFNDADGTRAAVEPHLGDLAAVVVEPIQGAAGVIPADRSFLAFLRELATAAGALLVFDEVISFRVGYHGAQGAYGIAPDLTTLGKIIGGGLPVGALGGRGEVLELFDPRRPDRLSHGGTFNANPLTAAAGIAALELLTREELDRLEALTLGLVEGIERAFSEEGVAVTVTHAGSLFNVHATAGPVRSHTDVLAGDLELLRRLHLGLLCNGILFTPRGMGCLSTPMTAAEVEAFVDGVRASLSGAEEPLRP
jgi:glutamate-1-semialdehyde 2,1-aminomutase